MNRRMKTELRQEIKTATQDAVRMGFRSATERVKEKTDAFLASAPNPEEMNTALQTAMDQVANAGEDEAKLARVDT